MLVAATRDGQARATVVADEKGPTRAAHINDWVDPWNTKMMTDGHRSFITLGQTMADHETVIHSHKQYADPDTGAHVNTAEALISQMQRAIIGVYHNLGAKHLQRYLNEVLWRWNHRQPGGSERS